MLQKCWQDLSRGGYFHDAAPFSLIKSYGFYFRVGEILAKKACRENYPAENFSCLQ